MRACPVNNSGLSKRDIGIEYSSSRKYEHLNTEHEKAPLDIDGGEGGGGGEVVYFTSDMHFKGKDL